MENDDPKLIIKKCTNKNKLHDARLIRKAVFVDEQGIDKGLESSGDETCDHFIAYIGNRPIGTLRVAYPDNNTAKIERMAVLKDFRSEGIGGKLIEYVLEHFSTKSTIKKISLNAQYQVEGFYKKHGFIEDGEVFYEAGLPHIKMYKEK